MRTGKEPKASISSKFSNAQRLAACRIKAVIKKPAMADRTNLHFYAGIIEATQLALRSSWQRGEARGARRWALLKV